MSKIYFPWSHKWGSNEQWTVSGIFHLILRLSFIDVFFPFNYHISFGCTVESIRKILKIFYVNQNTSHLILKVLLKYLLQLPCGLKIILYEIVEPMLSVFLYFPICSICLWYSLTRSLTFPWPLRKFST